MRWIALAIVLVIVLVTLGDASARMIRRRDPPVVEACRQRKDWSEVSACLAKLGTFTLDRTLGRSRLVHVWLDPIERAREELRRDAGFYLYVQDGDGTWHIGGMFDQPGGAQYLRGLAEVTIGRRTMHRIDVGTLLRTPLSLDGAPSISAVIHRQSSLYCYGSSHYCLELLTACDVMTRGKTLLSFHGTPRIAGQEVIADGDRRNAGSICSGTGSISVD